MCIVGLLLSWCRQQTMQVKWGTNYSSPFTVTNGVRQGPYLCCDRKSRAAYAQSFALWQQATIEFTCHDHSSRMLVVTFNHPYARIIRDYTPRSLHCCLFAPHICMVLFFTHIPFVVNHTINATPPERLQQHLLFTTNHTDSTFSF